MVLPQAYTNLSIFKRIEVWILLVLTAGGLVFVLLSGTPDDDPDATGGKAGKGENDPNHKTPSPTSPTEFKKDGPLVIERASVRRDGQGVFLTEVNFDFENQADTAVCPVEQAKLITASGKSVPVFILAFAPVPPAFPPKQKTSSSMLFSLKAEDLVGKLTLDIAGKRAAIKSGRSFDPASIPERQSKNFKNLDW